MVKQKNLYNVSRNEKVLLAVCSIITAAFVLFVSIATQGSLEYYTRLHAFVTIFMVCVLFIKDIPPTIVRIVIILGVLGAASAIFLVLAYLPYYMSHLEYINSLK